MDVAFDIILNFIGVLSCILAICGNSLTIAAIAKYQDLNTATNALILSLAVADLSTGLIVRPSLWVARLLIKEQNHFHWGVCYFGIFTSLLSFGGNILSICLISIDRFIYMHYPLKYHQIATLARTRGAILVMWGFLLVTASLSMAVGRKENPKSCRFSEVLSLKILLPIIGVIFIPATIVTVILYVKIAYLAWRKSRENLSGQDTNLSIGDSIQIKITKMMTIVLGSYFVLYVPSVTLTILAKSSSPKWLRQLQAFFTNASLANTWINPIIYAWRDKTFRAYFKKILLGMCPCCYCNRAVHAPAENVRASIDTVQTT